MSQLQKLDQFHQTRKGYLVFGLVELLMAWAFADWALDTGAWYWWVVTAFLVLGVVQNFGQFVLTFTRRKK